MISVLMKRTAPRKSIPWILIPGIALVLGAGAATTSHSSSVSKSKSELLSISRGGVLYDNWYDTVEQSPPQETHPSYPASGKLKGGETWLCVSCHGWDYKGVAGAFGSGPNKTGIKGIDGMAGKDMTVISAILRDETHRYTKTMLTGRAVIKLATFVNRGQIDMDKFINTRTKRSKGSTARGAKIYKNICQICHGLNGRLINFSSPEKPEYVGTVARRYPWRTLHKIRNGQPGVQMVSMITLPDRTLADILAYAQSLPVR